MSITATGISKRFGSVVALDDVSLDVPDRSLTALLGPSGGGKSTLLRVLAGLERPDAGTVRIAGADVTGVPARERGIGFVFQHYAAFRHLTVAENVGFALAVRRRPQEGDPGPGRGAARARPARRARGPVPLPAVRRAAPAHGPGPRARRRAPGAAARRAVRGAGRAIRAELREWLRRLHDQVPVTTIVVTHDQDEALELADQIVVVRTVTSSRRAPGRAVRPPAPARSS